MTIKQLLQSLNNYGIDIDCVHFSRNKRIHGYWLFLGGDHPTDFSLGTKYQTKKVLKRILKSFI